jgi:ferrous iron transport protein B
MSTTGMLGSGATARRATPFRLSCGPDIDAEIDALVTRITTLPALAGSFEPRWLAVKLLEGEPDIRSRVEALPGADPVLARADQGRERIASIYGDSADIAIADARYGFVHGVVREVMDVSGVSRYSLTDRLDGILANRVLGLPIFFAVMFVMFKLVVEVSAWYLAWVDAVIGGPVTRWAQGFLAMVSAPAWFVSLVLDGVIAGVGAVLVFVPGLVVLFLFLTLLEDSGYMARVAFVMDRVMRFTGLHGKSFIPMILGFGCAVPAILATRTLESRRQRIATSLLVPLMSCSARLPVYVVFGLAFFAATSGLLITGLYVLGIAIAGLVGLILSRTLLREERDAVFALELPPYRLPTLRALLVHTWQKTREFVVKAGTVILAVSVVLWLLMNLPWGVDDPRDSAFGQVSAAVAPVFEPAGFGTWEAAGALVSGFVAKEVVVSTLAQAYVGDAEPVSAEPPPSVAEDIAGIATGFVAASEGALRSTLSLVPGVDLVADEDPPAGSALSAALASAFSPLAGLAFVIFVLVYTPCVATLATIRSEFGWRWAGISAAYQLALAWLLAVLVFQLGTLLGFG